jgi:glyoxylase-like metal-dependent hydrolase (beta-lactamase superfamily II)/8-oxo-dGTP pyrophosphatase MutT (NUDIX family)
MGSEGGFEVVWLRRGTQLSFAGGYYAFPGGKLDNADGHVSVEGAALEEAALMACAARELFEETGVLVAQGAERLPKAKLEELRAALLAQKLGFSELLSSHGLRLLASDFVRAGRYVTPDSAPVRFDCRFFLVEAPPGAKVDIVPGEISEGGWVKPKEALSRWSDGTALLHPPILQALEVMEGFSSVAEAQKRLVAPPHMDAELVPTRVEFQKGVFFCPLRSPTLPPATHTNAYVLGDRELLVVDPGAGTEAEAGRLDTLLEELRQEGRTPMAVVLTHHHQDHVGSVPFLQRKWALPIWCHPMTAERVPCKVDRLLNEGDLLSLGGEAPMCFRVLHTPGHARGHICLVDERSKAAVVGDMVAGHGTILIDPPEGDMAQYLFQLGRLRDLGVRTLYPAHGAPLPDGPAKLDEYISHRRAREERVLQALEGTPKSLTQIAERAYADTPTAPLVIAERSTLAILQKLLAEGRAQETKAGFFIP